MLAGAWRTAPRTPRGSTRSWRPTSSAARRGAKHPVHDFLFTYYSYRPAQLRRWHPGYGVGLAGGDEYAELKGYEVDERRPGHGRASCRRQRPLIESLHRLLTATAGAAGQSSAASGCTSGRWSTGSTEDETRHADWPLRLGAAGTDGVVESHPIACSHFDAYRFFTGPARPRNALSPGRDDRPAHEQPALSPRRHGPLQARVPAHPMISSDLVADCFELARDIRVLDMRAVAVRPRRPRLRAGPDRDARGQGVRRGPAGLRRAGAPLRERLIDECDRLLVV